MIGSRAWLASSRGRCPGSAWMVPEGRPIEAGNVESPVWLRAASAGDAVTRGRYFCRARRLRYNVEMPNAAKTEKGPKIMAMHDWTVVTISMLWDLGRVTVELRDSASSVRTLVAEGVRELRIPRTHDWGPSASVNTASPLEALPTGAQRLKIEMQSGDVIEIVADQFDIPFE